MKKFFKFIVVGISNVTPGVCSASTSIVLGVYNDLLKMISNIFNIKYIKKYFIYYLALFIGIIVGIYGISYLYSLFPFLLNIIFLGIIIKNYPSNNVSSKNKLLNILLFLIGVITILLLNLLNNMTFILNYNEYDLKSNLIIVINGIFTSLAMILPGISGALLLVVLGLYEPLLEGIKSIIKGLITLNFNNIENLSLVIIFTISFVISLILISKFISKIIDQDNVYFKSIINGLIIGSICNIVFTLMMSEYYLYERIIGIIILLIILLYRKKA